MKRLFLIAALALAACTQTPSGSKIDPVRVASIARTALSGLEAAASSYIATNPMPLSVQVKIADAERAAEALVASLPTVLPANAVETVDQLVKSLNAVMAALPPDAVPPRVIGLIVALEIVAQTSVSVASK